MKTLNARAVAVTSDGITVEVCMEDGGRIRFPVSVNRRLRVGTVAQLNRVQLSPFGVHWPDLDEDLSYEGMLRGDFGRG
jgi:hypothetical protein